MLIFLYLYACNNDGTQVKLDLGNENIFLILYISSFQVKIGKLSLKLQERFSQPNFSHLCVDVTNIGQAQDSCNE